MRPSIARVIAASRPAARTRRPRDIAASIAVSPWTLLAIACASLLVAPAAVAAAFAVVSAVALNEALPVMPRRRGRSLPALAMFALVPLQFGCVAAAAWPLAATCVPLVAALGIPLVAVCARDTANLAEVCAQRYFNVMLYIYALSCAPALVLTLGAMWLVGVTLVAIAASYAVSRLSRRAARVTAVDALCLVAPIVYYSAAIR
jgi:phosphatidate cytidylyltransferase